MEGFFSEKNSFLSILHILRNNGRWVGGQGSLDDNDYALGGVGVITKLLCIT